MIVCEGEKTEPNYFKSFPKKIGKVIYDVQFEGGGINTIQVVEKAIEIRDNSAQKYDRVWAVFDRDSFTSQSFNNAILIAKAHNIKCAWSNEAFELWYLLHFKDQITSMNRDKYKNAIEDAINQMRNKKKRNKKKAIPFTYNKNDPNIYELLKKYGKQNIAIKRARKLCEKIDGEKFANYNPQTMVFKLVEELNGQSQEFINEINKKYEIGE